MYCVLVCVYVYVLVRTLNMKFGFLTYFNLHMQCSAVQCVFSHVHLFVTPLTVALQAPLSMEFSRQEYQSGVPFPSPGDLLHAGMKLTSLASPALTGGFFATAPPGKQSVYTLLLVHSYNTLQVLCCAKDLNTFHFLSSSAPSALSSELYLHLFCLICRLISLSLALALYYLSHTLLQSNFLLAPF